MRSFAGKALKVLCAFVLAFSLTSTTHDLWGSGISSQVAYAADDAAFSDGTGLALQTDGADASSDGEDADDGGSGDGDGSDAKDPDASEPNEPDADTPDPKPSEPDPKPDTPDAKPEQPDETEKPDASGEKPSGLTIVDLAIRFDGLTGEEAGITYSDGLEYGDLLAFASNPTKQVRATLSAKGQQIQMFAVAYWSDGSEEPGGNYVEWSSSDTSVAKVSTGGLITPVADGKVRFDCKAKTSRTGGAKVVASLWMNIKGQSDSRYVSAINIIDADGKKVGEGPILLDETIENPAAFLRFAALVDVVDPVTGKTERYDTRKGLLSKQASDLADLQWSVNASDMGFVDETGLYRPKEYGTVVVYADSPAGKAGEQVRSQVMVQTIDPEGNLKPDFHPQDTLTVKAFYETKPPTNLKDPDDENFVINKEYSLSDLQALGVQTATYTTLAATSYYTINASGVPVAAVLRDAGVNLDGVATLEFGTFDGYTTPLSFNFLYQDRYYYPNIGNADNKFQGAEQVYPILAFSTSRVRNGDTVKNYDDMNEATRYELVFGATPDGGNSQYQVKWIHTLYVVLAGGPPAQSGKGDPASGGDGGSGSAPTGEGAGGNGGQGAGSAGNGAGSGDGGPGEGGSGSEAGKADGAADASSGDAAAGAQQVGALVEADGAGAYDVYQIMNKNPSETEKDLTFDNPYKKFVTPTMLLVLIIGAAQAAWWYRRQAQATPWVPDAHAAAGA